MLNNELDQYKQYGTPDEIAFTHTLFKLAKQGCINPFAAEMGCAGGNIVEILLTEGYRVVGVDLCQDALTHISTRFKETKDRFQILNADFRTCQFSELLTTITCWSNTFSIITSSEERVDILKHWNSLLCKDGKLLLWLLTDRDFSRPWKLRNYEVPEGTLSINSKYEEDRVNMTRKLSRVLSLYTKGNESNIPEKSETHEFVGAIIPQSLAQKEIKDAGFTILDQYGDLLGNRLESDSLFQIYHCQKV